MPREASPTWLEDFDPDEVDFEPARTGFSRSIFPDGTVTYVLNRQAAVDQMWFAAGARAWHYDWHAETESWRDDKEGGDLYERIGETVSRKLGREVRP